MCVCVYSYMDTNIDKCAMPMEQHIGGVYVCMYARIAMDTNTDLCAM